jgi:hypothetical protein
LAQVIRQNLSLEHRIADCQRRAKDQHVDITSALFFIGKQRSRGRDDNAQVRILALEARLDGVEVST